MSANKFRPPQSDTMSVASDSTPVGRLARSSTITTPRKETVTPRKELSTLYSGEPISKSDKILGVIGSLDELCTYIGVVKAEHLNPNVDEKFDIDSSAKLFLYARLTQIQEALIDIEASIGTSRKIPAKYEFTRFSNGEQRIKELDSEIALMSDINISQLKENIKEKPLQHIPGTSVLESRLLYARSICRRAERQLYSCKNLQVGIIPEDNCANYLNKLGDYFLALSIHTLHMQNKEPLKKAGRTNTKTFQPNLK